MATQSSACSFPAVGGGGGAGAPPGGGGAPHPAPPAPGGGGGRGGGGRTIYKLMSGLWEYLRRVDEYHVLIVGLDAAGKSTFLERVKREHDCTYQARREGGRAGEGGGGRGEQGKRRLRCLETLT